MAPRIIFAFTLLAMSACAFGLPRGHESPETMLQHIYASYRPWDGHGPARGEVFDAALLELFRRDDECSKVSGPVGAVDFDPFLDSQAFDDEGGISKPAIRLVSRDPAVTYEVTFRLFPRLPDSAQRKLLYTFVRENENWRIADIAYEKGLSLKQLLSQACPPPI